MLREHVDGHEVLCISSSKSSHEDNVFLYDELMSKEISFDADFIIMTSRASFSKYDKRTCFDAYKGQDLFFVKRKDLILSKFTKIK